MDTSKGCAVNKLECLNESPSEKEGKSAAVPCIYRLALASMKVPPKRKGNFRAKA